MNNNYKNALLFVQISTHFREIFRVARLMKKRGAYSPKVFFVAPYEGWKQDFQQCQSEGIDCICYFNQPVHQYRDLSRKRNKIVRLFLFLVSKSEIKKNKINNLTNLIQKNILHKLNKIKVSLSHFYRVNIKKIGLIHVPLIVLRNLLRKLIAVGNINVVIKILCRGLYNAVQILLRGISNSIYILLESVYTAIKVILVNVYNKVKAL
ncbi:TPA: hypothetical protein ACG3OE_003329, partial [Legionella pneumophila]